MRSKLTARHHSLACLLVFALVLPALAYTTPTSTPPGKYKAPSATQPGEVVIKFDHRETGKTIPSVTENSVVFELASVPRSSRSQGRVMFFPHLKTPRNGLINGMANEQGIPVKIQLPVPATKVTLLLWGSIGANALVEAYDTDGKLVGSDKLPGTVPERTDPAAPLPSFEFSVSGQKISYLLFGGAPNGGYLALDELRVVPMAQWPATTAPAK